MRSCTWTVFECGQTSFPTSVLLFSIGLRTNIIRAGVGLLPLRKEVASFAFASFPIAEEKLLVRYCFCKEEKGLKDFLGNGG